MSPRPAPTRSWLRAQQASEARHALRACIGAGHHLFLRGLRETQQQRQVKVAVEADGKRAKICLGQHSQSPPSQVLVDGLLDRVDARLCKSARKFNSKARGEGGSRRANGQRQIPRRQLCQWPFSDCSCCGGPYRRTRPKPLTTRCSPHSSPEPSSRVPSSRAPHAPAAPVDYLPGHNSTAARLQMCAAT